MIHYNYHYHLINGYVQLQVHGYQYSFGFFGSGFPATPVSCDVILEIDQRDEGSSNVECVTLV